jgi:hypothetical protein
MFALRMTLVELLTFLTVILCGALVGVGVGGVVGLLRGAVTSDLLAHGGFLGAVATLFGFLACGQWFSRINTVHPPCRCGKSDWKDFELGCAEGLTNVWQCVCGRRYSWPKSQLWIEIDGQGSSRLFMRRDFLGRWRELQNEKSEPGGAANRSQPFRSD